MPWPDHVATGLHSFLFICLIILPKVYFHFYSFVSQEIALLDALAGSCCQRFTFISIHLSPRRLLCWMPWPDHVAKGLLSFLFICLPEDGFAGWLSRIILPKVCRFAFISFYLSPRRLLCWMAWPDHFAKGSHFLSFVSQVIALLDGLAG